MLRDVHYCRVTRSQTMSWMLLAGASLESRQLHIKKRQGNTAFEELQQKELYACLSASGFTFVPTLKALCMARLANMGRERDFLRVDPLLHQLYNTEVKTCQRPFDWPRLLPNWTAYATVNVNRVVTPATRNGKHYEVVRQCVSCWIRDPDSRELVLELPPE